MGNFHLETTSISSTMTENLIYSWNKRAGIYNMPSILSVFSPVHSLGQSPMSEGHSELSSNRMINPICSWKGLKVSHKLISRYTTVYESGRKNR